MKVTKTYSRYLEENTFGVIVSEQPKVIYTLVEGASCCVSGASEKVILWNLKKADPVTVFSRPNSVVPVTCYAVSKPTVSDQPFLLAAGYTDGWVHIYDVSSGDLEAHFRAGRSRVTSMDFENETLISAADSEINVLDLVSGSGFRLKGHKGVISRVKLLSSRNIALSCAQDGFIKFWDLKNQHCFATLTGHSGPVWDFALAREDSILVSGATDANLRVWKIAYADRSEGAVQVSPMHKNSDVLDSSSLQCEHQSLIRLEYLGHVQRASSRRVNCLAFDATGSYLVCQSFERNLEIFWLLDDDAQAKRLKKKIKKAKDRDTLSGEVHLSVSDLLLPILCITMPVKLASCDVLPLRPIEWKDGVCLRKVLRVVSALKNNSLEEIEVVLPTTGPVRLQTLKVSDGPCRDYRLQRTDEASGAGANSKISAHLTSRIAAHGHRSPPLACCLTSDGLGIFSLGKSEAKLWNRHTGACLATLDWRNLDRTDKQARRHPNMEDSTLPGPDKACVIALAPGDRNVIIGFESGHLLMFDVNSKSVKQSITAHQGAVRGLALSGDKKGIISGGADKNVGFYNFDLNIPDHGPPSLCLVASREKQVVADQVTCLACSPNNRLLIFGLVNFHVDVYFSDSFKRIHSLYGHAAPVTSVDISSDSRLILTGGGDKTVRLWELQFGNCQRRFASHTEPVSSVRFIPHTPLAVSADLGGNIKQWDVVKLREVTNLRGHSEGVTCLATGAANAAIFASLQKKKAVTSSSGKGRTANRRSSRVHSDGQDEGENDDEDLLVGGLVVSTGRDFTIRVWSESDELLVLEEEAELAREAAEDEEELARADTVAPGATPADVGTVALLGRPTINTRDAADFLMEAIDVYSIESAKFSHSGSTRPNPTPHPLMLARGYPDSPEHFLLTSLSTLRSTSSRLGGGGAGLEHALGALTTHHVRLLLPHLANWLAKGWNPELAARALRHLVALHVGLVTSSRELRDVLQRTRAARLGELTNLKNLVGMNVAGLEYLQRKLEESQQIVLFNELWKERSKKIQHPNKRGKRSRMALLLTSG